MGEDEVFLGNGNGQAGAVGVAGFFQQGRDKALYGAGGDAQLCGDLLLYRWRNIDESDLLFGQFVCNLLILHYICI